VAAFLAPLLLGAASGGASALQSIGNYRQGVAAADASNAQSDARYAYALQNKSAIDQAKAREWQGQLQIRKLKTQEYQARNKQIGIAYGEALFDNQAKQNAIVQQSMGEKLRAQIQLMQANSANAAKGRQGKRANISNQVNNIVYGMESINRAEDLGTSEYMAQRRAEGFQRQASNDMTNNYYQTGVGVDLNYARPTFGPAPIHGGYTQGPSPFGLFGSLLGAGLTGIGAYNTASAPQNRILGGYGANG
jgi:hypothetical protein